MNIRRMKKTRENDYELDNLMDEPSGPAMSDRKGTTLDRSKLGLGSTLALCLTCIVLDTAKQLLNYAISYYNNKEYPINETAVVAITEFLKLIMVVAIVLLRGDQSLGSITPSLKFVAPSLLYTMNNNVYLYALHFVAPPVWLILIQSRVVMTTLVYRFWFKRDVFPSQWLGTFFIMVGISCTQLYPMLMDSKAISVPTFSLVLSLISAALSVAASVYMETLFKNDKRPFAEQQIQLYGFSLIIAVAFQFIQNTSAHTHREDPSQGVMILFVLSLLCSSLGGIVIAAVIKCLDNIVKYYASGTANLLTGAASHFLFPETFKLNMGYGMSMVALLTGIYLYEKKPKAKAGEAGSGAVQNRKG